MDKRNVCGYLARLSLEQVGSFYDKHVQDLFSTSTHIV